MTDVTHDSYSKFPMLWNLETMTARYRGTHNEGTKKVAAGWLTRAG